jgi:biopolymer transport protein ExbD
MADTDWQFRRASSRKVYTGLSRARLARALQEGKIDPNDLVLPPGTRTWVAVEAGLAQVSEAAAPAEARPAITRAAASSVGTGPVRLEGRLVRVADEEDTELDMTPMIDVVFQLLIFFMLTSAFLAQAQVDLPDAVTGRGETAEERVVVDLVPDKTASIGAKLLFSGDQGVATDPDKLTETIKDRLATADFKEVLIRGAKDAPIGAVRLVMNRASEAGAEKILVAVDELRQ